MSCSPISQTAQYLKCWSVACLMPSCTGEGESRTVPAPTTGALCALLCHSPWQCVLSKQLEPACWVLYSPAALPHRGEGESQTTPAPTAPAAHALLLHTLWQCTPPEQLEPAQSRFPPLPCAQEGSRGTKSPAPWTGILGTALAVGTGGGGEQPMHLQHLACSCRNPPLPTHTHPTRGPWR